MIFSFLTWLIHWFHLLRSMLIVIQMAWVNRINMQRKLENLAFGRLTVNRCLRVELRIFHSAYQFLNSLRIYQMGIFYFQKEVQTPIKAIRFNLGSKLMLNKATNIRLDWEKLEDLTVRSVYLLLIQKILVLMICILIYLTLKLSLRKQMEISYYHISF